MGAYYFVRIPVLPAEVSHQDRAVRLVEYRAREKDRLEAGQTIAVVENWWATMALKAVGPGYLSKTFFDPQTYIHEGDPFAIVICDPEDGPKGKDTCELEVIGRIREKPVKKK